MVGRQRQDLRGRVTVAGAGVCLVGAGLVGAGVWAGSRDAGPVAARATPTPAVAPTPGATALPGVGTPSPAGAVADRPPPLTGRDWAAVRYPLDCGDAGVRLQGRRYADLTGDGYVDAVVMVACAAGAGSPPDALYVYDGRSPAGTPRLLSTLLDGSEDLLVTRVTLTAGTVTATAVGYSSAAVPSASPDVTRTLRWHWNGLRLAPVPDAGTPA